MGSLDVDSLFTNIALEETIGMCTNELFKESETVEGLSKSEFKELLSPATKDSHFIFDIHFGRFLPSTYKNGKIHILLHRCFRSCSDWTKFYLELVK